MNKTMLKQIVLVGLLGLFSSQTTGCFLFSKMMRRNRIKKQRAERKQKAKAALQEFFTNKDCSKVTKLYKASNGRISRAMKTKKYKHYGYELGRCGKWDFFFSKVVHYGNSSTSAPGLLMLKHMEAKGLPVLAKFKAWHSKSSSWVGQSGRYARYYNMYMMYASKHVTNWLLSKPSPRKYCSLFTTRYSQYHNWVKNYALIFLAKANCGSALRMHRSALLSNNVGLKQLACRYLGNKGTRRDISRLYTLARTDSSWIRRGRRRTWTSTVCRSAAGRIRLRLN